MRRLFGTDGIRGTANEEPMTAETALKVAMAAGRHFVPSSDRRSLAVIGKDTRLSGYMLEPAMVAGFTAIGMDVVLVGPIPTPAIAMLTRSLRADLGVMLSASHNPHHDNGIKLFGPDGFKLSDEVEAEIEAQIGSNDPSRLAPAAKLGRARRMEDARGRYIEAVKASFPRGMRLNGLKIVVDCAHGAAYRVAPTVFYELGAEVIAMSVDPDGVNINDGCGAVHPQALQQRVRDEGADLGIALDGDADRLIMVDETGALIDGDQILAAIASSWADQGRLANDTVVATVMSNLGLERYLAAKGIALHRSSVGDRYVLEAMREGGFNIGGEQSGHVILSEYASTGDGVIAALQVLVGTIRDGRPMSEVARTFVPLPQVLRNVRYTGIPALDDPAVQEAIGGAQTRLGDKGRLLIRPSGTEPLLRVMAEGEDDELVRSVVEDVAARIEGLVN